jgi:acetyl esterase/lipase
VAGDSRSIRTFTSHATRPPTFLLHAQADTVDDVNHSLVYYKALKDAGVLTVMHLYTDGGHAFWAATHQGTRLCAVASVTAARIRNRLQRPVRPVCSRPMSGSSSERE